MKRIALAVILITTITGCGRGSAKDVISADRLSVVAQKTSLQPRDFAWSFTMGGHKVTMTGAVQDDYRYQATVQMDGKPAYREVVIDDARYLRVDDPSLLMDASAFMSVDPAWTAASLGWVVDPKGAPGEFVSKRQEAAPLDPRYVLDRVRFLETLPPVLKQGYREYNTDAVTYLPKDDKFPAHKADGTRFDHFPNAYDPNAITVTFDSVKPFFEYVSVWGDLGAITRVEFLMTLPDPSQSQYRELYRQIKRAGSRSLNSMITLGAPGRKFAQTYTTKLNDDASITPPLSPTQVDLRAGQEALTKALQTQAPDALIGPLVGYPT